MVTPDQHNKVTRVGAIKSLWSLDPGKDEAPSPVVSLWAAFLLLLSEQKRQRGCQAPSQASLCLHIRNTWVMRNVHAIYSCWTAARCRGGGAEPSMSFLRFISPLLLSCLKTGASSTPKSTTQQNPQPSPAFGPPPASPVAEFCSSACWGPDFQQPSHFEGHR